MRMGKTTRIGLYGYQMRLRQLHLDQQRILFMSALVHLMVQTT